MVFVVVVVVVVVDVVFVVVVAVVDVVVLDDVVGSIELLVVIGIYAPLWSILKPSSKE